MEIAFHITAYSSEPGYFTAVKKVMSGMSTNDMRTIIKGMEKIRQNVRQEEQG
jgi:hypothetical protein